MRKVVVLHPPINYVVCKKSNPQAQVAWFADLGDAEEFLDIMLVGSSYEIAEVRK